MQGADEYARLFSTGQYGKLYLVSGSHARGLTFHIWVLPDDKPVESIRYSDAVEVYGITGGQPGWSETYGWLHHGKWEQDFYALVESRKAEIARASVSRYDEKLSVKEAEKRRVAAILERY
jgi:hypothetical protein